MTTIIALLTIAGLAYHIMTPKERERLARSARTRMLDLLNATSMSTPANVPLRDALCARTRRPLVTVALVVLNAAIFTLMLFARGPLGDPDTLVSWGANVGPRTTNGEWWRLVTMMFVHSGWLHLLATIAGLIPLGLLLERLVGSVAFGTVFLGAGILAGIVSLSTSAVAVSAGASGAIFGIYGLLTASVIWGAIANPHVPIPVATANRVIAPAVAFVLYNVANDSIGIASELAGFVTGFIGGLVIARGVIQYKPPVRRSAVATVAALVLALGTAVPLRGIADVRGDIERVVAFEERTAGAYGAAVDRFKKGRVAAASLAELIDRTILPELQTARARLNSLERVSREQQPMMTAAREYFALREKAWQLRAAGLQKASMPALREADRVELASLGALERIRYVKASKTAVVPVSSPISMLPDPGSQTTPAGQPQALSGSSTA